jgi:pimeloyl-ACP methyl ester carboxylesterase
MAMDMRPTNPSIKKPTLVICGEEDTGTTPVQAKEIADAIPGAALELIPSAAHLANIEQPVAFTNALLKLVMNNR